MRDVAGGGGVAGYGWPRGEGVAGRRQGGGRVAAGGGRWTVGGGRRVEGGGTKAAKVK
jgi:hypothetical protein